MSAAPNPVVKAEIIMLPAAAIDRFGEITKAYIWITPAGIASANISANLLAIIYRKCDKTMRRSKVRRGVLKVETDEKCLKPHHPPTPSTLPILTSNIGSNVCPGCCSFPEHTFQASSPGFNPTVAINASFIKADPRIFFPAPWDSLVFPDIITKHDF